MDKIVLEIIANITGFITYFAPGYIFISCFNYSACIQRETEKEYLIIKSISISYLFYVFANYMGELFNLTTATVQVITFLNVILLGLIFGKIHRAKWANAISLFFFKREMTNNLFVDIWSEADAVNCVVYVTLTLKNNLGIYEGQICKVSSYNTNPEILLSYYLCYDNNGNIISDYSDIENTNLLVYYSDIQKFEFELIPINDNAEVTS